MFARGCASANATPTLVAPVEATAELRGVTARDGSEDFLSRGLGPNGSFRRRRRRCDGSARRAGAVRVTFPSSTTPRTRVRRWRASSGGRACLGSRRRDGERPDGRASVIFIRDDDALPCVRMRREREGAQTSTRTYDGADGAGCSLASPSDTPSNYERHGVFRARGGEGGGGGDATPRAPPRQSLRPHLRRGDRRARLHRWRPRHPCCVVRDGDFFEDASRRCTASSER